MLIRKNRIRNLDRYMRGIARGSSVVISLSVDQVDRETLTEIGFSEDLNSGETVLPSDFGSITRYNSEGKNIVHRDQPMETVYRQREWTWEEFNGPYETTEQTRIVEIPYQRYPRTFIEPPSIELSLATNTRGRDLVVSPIIAYERRNEEMLLHTINIFLEIFGVCNLSDENLDEIIIAPVRRVNWDLLPQGQLPWNRLRPHLSGALNTTTPGNRIVIEKRFEAINSHEPNFVAVGRAGFSGYVVFGFPNLGINILESTETNNATYVLGEDWQYLSGLTKAQILNHNLHRERIIHRENWFDEIDRILSA